MIRVETPRGWTVHFKRRGTGGATVFSDRRIEVPALKYGYRTLWVFFHEVGHALRFIEGKHRIVKREHRITPLNIGSAHEEWIAETFAIEMMTRYGFPIVASELAFAKRAVRVYVRHEERLGFQTYIPVKNFIRRAA